MCPGSTMMAKLNFAASHSDFRVWIPTNISIRHPFANCERYEPDEDAAHEFWNHKLDANVEEANLRQRIILRYVVWHVWCVITSLLAKQGGSSFCPYLSIFTLNQELLNGKLHFVGYSRWKAGERYDHRYLAIPPNVNEEEFRVLLDNGGVPSSLGTKNTKWLLLFIQGSDWRNELFFAKMSSIYLFR